MKKLKYILLLIITFVIFTNNAKAETLQMGFTSFFTTYSTFQVEQNTDSYYVINAYAPGGGKTVNVWVSNNTYSCAASALIKGKFKLSDNPNFFMGNYNYVTDVFYHDNSGDTACNHSIQDNIVSFSCIVPSISNNFEIGYGLDALFETTYNTYVYKSFEIACNSDNVIIDQNQTIIDQNNQTNEKLDNIEDTITDSNIDSDSVSSSFEDFNNFLDDNSTITQLITLPITLYTAILNNVGAGCQPFSLGSMYGEELVLPCVNIGTYLGSTLWGMIDLIISGFAIYSISKKLIKVFNTFSSMKEGDVIDD